MTATEIVSFACTLLFGSGAGILGSVLYYKPKIRIKTAEATKAEIDVYDKKHDYLEGRIANMEKMYAEQGIVLDELRSKYLVLNTDFTEIKLENIALRRELDSTKKELSELRVENEELRRKINKQS